MSLQLSEKITAVLAASLVATGASEQDKIDAEIARKLIAADLFTANGLIS